MVRALADVPGGPSVSDRALNDEQADALDGAGIVFVSAGAGTGKTRVLVERYVRAIVEGGLSIDSILVITYTERAAAELGERIRRRFRELDRADLAREIDRAWISTIHGFCLRVLKGSPFEAGLDPRFRVLDESQARVISAEAFREALARFCTGGDPARLRLLGSYTSDDLGSMLTGIFGRLRSAGRPLVLDAGQAVDFPGALAALDEAARSLEDAGGPVGAYAGEIRARVAHGESEGIRRLPDPPEEAGERRVAKLADAVEGARKAALHAVAARDAELLQALLDEFDTAYRQAKDRESGVDFEDLQLRARDLLRRSPDVLAELQLRFRSIMVDEFQDTNRLQCELIDLLAGSDGNAVRGAPAELFFVGDEFQSIYRFRHADVDVFRERRSQSSAVLALATNYRSRPEVIDVVNHLFSSTFGPGFQPLVPGGDFPEPAFAPPVELLVTDRASYGSRAWRRAEAEHVAGRVAELVESGQYTPGDVVLLFAAGTNAEAHEQALRARGLPTHRVAGRGYFSQQQVVDLLSYLRLLHNRYDDEALMAVLASPFVGVSNDALVLLREAAPRRPLFTGLERSLPAGLSDRDRQLLEAFRQRYERLASSSGRIGLDRLCERIVAEHDYDLAVLSRWDGKHRYPNLRKLARMARSYEDLRGPDIEGFLRFMAAQQEAGAVATDAAADEEGAEVVRLLTIHSAKGLEFRVVVVCDAGSAGGGSNGAEILCLPDGRFGFRVVDPLDGGRVEVLDYEEVKEAERAANEQERHRLYYVGMTRAQDRLIVSGSLDLSKADSATTPIAWMIAGLGVDVTAESPHELMVGETPVVVRIDQASEGDADEEAGAAQDEEESEDAEPAPGQLELFAPGTGGVTAPGYVLPPLQPVAEPPPFELRRLSYSALALFSRCPYRFYAERVIGLRPRDRERAVVEGPPGLGPAEIGDAVHQVLELADPTVLVDDLLATRFPSATPENVQRVSELVEAWRRSELGRTVDACPDVRREHPFALVNDGVLLHGRFDAFHRDGDGAVVVDYKTNRVGDASPAGIVEAEYHLQRLIYALAVLGSGYPSVEVVFTFLERPEEPVRKGFHESERDDLTAELTAAIDRVRKGPFIATPGPFACSGCPALHRVCAGVEGAER